MPTKKIADVPRYCRHPDHDPPKHMVWSPGVYEHECPSCGYKTRFTVHDTSMHEGYRYVSRRNNRWRMQC